VIGWIKGKLLWLLGILTAAAGMFALWERGQAKAQKAARAEDQAKAEHAQAQQLINASNALHESEAAGNDYTTKVDKQADSGDFGSLGDQ